MRGDKSGQFYLIAAIILVTIIVSLLSITNYSQKKDNTRIENIGRELEIESEKVFDYDKINGQNEIENFTGEYSYYVGEEIKLYFITGDENALEAYTYENGIKIDLSSESGIIEDKIIFAHEETEYSFDLNKGKNFYFVLSQDIGGEKYVYTN